MYSNGEGITLDKNKALYWYEKSATQGNSDAQYTLGIMYVEGDSVTADKDRGLYWITKSYKKGNALARSFGTGTNRRT